MKKLILVAACLGLLSTGVTAQTTGGGAAKSKASAKYFCPKCLASKDKPGTCSACNKKLVREGDYYCTNCGASSTKTGKCTSCNKEMVKMTGK